MWDLTTGTWLESIQMTLELLVYLTEEHSFLTWLPWISGCQATLCVLVWSLFWQWLIAENWMAFFSYILVKIAYILAHKIFRVVYVLELKKIMFCLIQGREREHLLTLVHPWMPEVSVPGLSWSQRRSQEPNPTFSTLWHGWQEHHSLGQFLVVTDTVTSWAKPFPPPARVCNGRKVAERNQNQELRAGIVTAGLNICFHWNLYLHVTSKIFIYLFPPLSAVHLLPSCKVSTF